MLLGLRDFPDFKREIISEISEGTDGTMKKEFPTLPLMKVAGDLLDLGTFLVISWEILTKNSLKMFAITVGSEVILPSEALSLLLTFTLLDFLILINDLIPDHNCFMLLLFFWK